VTKQQQQADSKIHKDRFLNFLVNELTDAFGESLSESADIDPEYI